MMIRFGVFSTLLILGTMVSAQTNPTAEKNSLAHVSNRFVVMVKASYQETAVLFSPSGERVWAGKEWNPQFLYPQTERDVEGAVFTVQHGSHKSVWVNSIRDIEARHFQYVYFIPDALVTTIDVRFSPINEGATSVEVVYTRTALDVETNEHVLTLGEHDSANGPEWQALIDNYLKSKNSVAH
jgi:outer membrane protein assembly factor BamB